MLRIASLPRSPSKPITKQLVWTTHTSDDWEILFYRTGQTWEACFFRWAEHHEHAVGASKAELRATVERRIRILRSRNQRTAKWRSRED
ncbi:MAG TPA: hypothetical protein VLB68_22935 [Pyrinomonadaceae bacterium]|nr:hypothetical protein [Pyrinomonadaceae bacterium]